MHTRTGWWHAAVAAILMATMACTTGSSSSSSSSSSTSGGGGGCTCHANCPQGFACRLRQCQTTCTSNTPLTGGCVVGATCNAGTCVNNTSCSDTVDCAYEKGEVCRFSTGQCVDAWHVDAGVCSSTCDEAANPTCSNGYGCHVKVCYQDCTGSAGCAAGKTCQNGTCQ